MQAQISLDMFGEHADEKARKKHTNTLVRAIKKEEADLEWYPTTPEILACIRRDIETVKEQRHFADRDEPSVLDCGAGDGRSLIALTQGKRYAIEKSEPLIQAMDKNTYIIGADFHAQSLLDKEVDVTFSNPPYSEFSAWASKIIRETRSGFVYLVIPSRWKSQQCIQDAIKLREAEVDVLDSFDFHNADRKARAVVDIVKVSLTSIGKYQRGISAETDPFTLWFRENFDITVSADPLKEEPGGESHRKARLNKALVSGSDLVSALVNLYQHDLDHLVHNYKALETVDGELLGTLGVSMSGLLEALRLKIEGLKNGYWQELFNNLRSVTDRLTSTKRRRMLEELLSHTRVDFNEANIRAVVCWALKHANTYYDEQLIDLVEVMTEQANIALYKSNEHTFGKERWRYGRQPEGLDRYGLDYRIVLHRSGGVCSSEWEYERTKFNGLDERARDFLLDMRTVATNLGFDCTGEEGPMDVEHWESRAPREFWCARGASGKRVLLAKVRAYLNGNMHVQFSQEFIQRLNVEFGRLKGWLKSAGDAAQELDIAPELAASMFGSNLRLGSDSTSVLLGIAPSPAE